MKTAIIAITAGVLLSSCATLKKTKSHEETTKADTSAHVVKVDKTKIVTTETVKKDTVLPADTVSKRFKLPEESKPVIIENEFSKTVIEKDDGGGYKATTITKPRRVDIEHTKTTVEERDVETETEVSASKETHQEHKEAEKKPPVAVQIGQILAQFWYLWIILLLLLIWRFRKFFLPI